MTFNLVHLVGTEATIVVRQTLDCVEIVRARQREALFGAPLQFASASQALDYLGEYLLSV